ncbi:hypothetical protein [Escherichia coli]|uniref:hypothetical protein n=1 Tax=Escherichia coli TaxID=562 RepID=UPI0021118622|nr:hypothetical protein [Escherichia coli]EHO7054882.1 hypothetical protein [Escherichia coli]EMB7583391.1 hypothetical protein [Escherichia coli]MCQ6921873.1 hypothetical protein [Escherichia coli]MCQ6951377.1 hypothetical protein [Escherichia coli]
MKLKKRIYLLAGLMVVVCQARADVQPNTSTNRSWNPGYNTVLSVNVATGQWYNGFAVLDLSTAAPRDTSCGYMCTSPQTVKVNHLGFPFGRGTFNFYGTQERTVSTPDGPLTIRFRFNDITLFLRMTNRNNGNNFDKTFLSDAAESDREITPGNKCGNLGGCTYQVQSGFASGKIIMDIKLPPALSQKTYDLGSISVADIVVLASPTRENQSFVQQIKTSTLTVHPTITVPDRCYINIDNGSGRNPSSYAITFSDIDASSVSTGTPLQSKTIKLSSTCIGVAGALKDVVSEVKLEPSGVTTVADDYIFKLKPTKNDTQEGERYLGIIARDTVSGNKCNMDGSVFTSGQYKTMGTVVVAGSQSGGTNSLISPYPVTFSLCGFGDRSNLLIPGDHTGAVRLTTRWKFQ